MSKQLLPLQITRIRDVLVILLAAISGYVDAVSYLGLDHVFTANMTGNTVLFGLAIGGGDLMAALRSGVALGGYIVGVGIGAAIVHDSKPGDLWPVAVNRVFIVEFVALAALTIGGVSAHGEMGPQHQLLHPLIVLSSVAMGLQSSAVRPLSVPGITTTYITGTWTSLITFVAVRLHLKGAWSRSDAVVPSASGTGLQAGVLLVYGIAAVAGGLGNARWGLASFLVPTLAIAFVIGLAFVLFHRRGSSDSTLTA